jgi:hypothetical protein
MGGLAVDYDLILLIVLVTLIAISALGIVFETFVTADIDELSD